MQVSDSSLGTPLLMHPSYSQGRVWRKINPPYLHPPFIDWIHGLVRAPGPTNERGSYDLSRWLFQLGDQLSITTSSPSPRWEIDPDPSLWRLAILLLWTDSLIAQWRPPPFSLERCSCHHDQDSATCILPSPGTEPGPSRLGVMCSNH